MKREELDVCTLNGEGIETWMVDCEGTEIWTTDSNGNKYYYKSQADKVMDAMERRIARLTALVEGLKKNSLVLGEIYHKRLAQEQARIKELVKAKRDILTRNVELIGENAQLTMQVRELEATISKMETTTPKWISVKDRLPPKGQHVLVVRNHRLRSLYPIDVVCWSEDYITHDIVTHWMPLPSAPTTEEK